MNDQRTRPARRRLLVAGAAFAALVAAVGGYAVSQAQQESPAAAAKSELPAGRTYTVTLVSGDVVTVHTRQSGCPGVEVRLAEPDGGYRTSCGPDGHMRVLPTKVAPLVGRVLDADLFDVTTLIQEGYDDARSADIPLIVRGGQTRAALAGQRALPSIGAVAGRQPKSGAAGFVARLAGPAARSGAAKVWLDHRVHATTAPLDANLRQVRAPQAWAAGHTGAGVRVAVLDTGADPTWPARSSRRRTSRSTAATRWTTSGTARTSRRPSPGQAPARVAPAGVWHRTPSW